MQTPHDVIANTESITTAMEATSSQSSSSSSSSCSSSSTSDSALGLCGSESEDGASSVSTVSSHGGCDLYENAIDSGKTSLLTHSQSSSATSVASAGEVLSQAAQYATVLPSQQQQHTNLTGGNSTSSLAQQLSTVSLPSRPSLGARTISNNTSSTARPSPSPSSTPADTPAATHVLNPIDTAAAAGVGAFAQLASAVPTTTTTTLPMAAPQIDPLSPANPASGSSNTASSSASSPTNSYNAEFDRIVQPLKEQQQQQQQKQTHHHQPSQPVAISTPKADPKRDLTSPDSWRSLLPKHDRLYANEAVLAERYEARKRAEALNPPPPEAPAPGFFGMTMESAYIENGNIVSRPKGADGRVFVREFDHLIWPRLSDRDRHMKGTAWREFLPDDDPMRVREQEARARREEEAREEAEAKAARLRRDAEMEAARLRQAAEAEAAQRRDAEWEAVRLRRAAQLEAARRREADEMEAAIAAKSIKRQQSSDAKYVRFSASIVEGPVAACSDAHKTTITGKHVSCPADARSTPAVHVTGSNDDDDDDEQTTEVKTAAAPKPIRPILKRSPHNTAKVTVITPTPTSSVALGSGVHVETSPSEYYIRANVPSSIQLTDDTPVKLGCSQKRVLKISVKGGAFARSFPFRPSSDADLKMSRAFCDGQDVVVMVPRMAFGVAGINAEEFVARQNGSVGTDGDEDEESLQDIFPSRRMAKTSMAALDLA